MSLNPQRVGNKRFGEPTNLMVSLSTNACTSAYNSNFRASVAPGLRTPALVCMASFLKPHFINLLSPVGSSPTSRGTEL